VLILIPALPLAGFLLNAGIGRRLSKRASGSVAVGAMIGSLGVSLAAVSAMLGRRSEEVEQQMFAWITSGDFQAAVALRLDPLSALMILVVTLVGTLIHVYSTAYMHAESEAGYARYFSYLNLFAAFMLLLVLGANFLMMFVGWEGVGLSSYLLIGFWHERRAAAAAGKKAFIVNRVGDAGFVLGVLLVVAEFGTVDFQQVARSLASVQPEAGFGPLSLMTLLLFVGAAGKSAQIPLHVWLPDAMEGPTPVSALIHAATMVTAGVYMIARNAVLFSHAPLTLALVAGVGLTTAFVAGTIGLVQNDIKRVLAYSTVSQLGYMFLALGVGAYAAGIFHLLTHAFFKALLFLGAGALIHALAGEQDLRRMGGLRSELPLTYWTFVIGALALVGVPGFAGFFSKDEILFRTYASGHTFLWAAGLVTALLTAVYTFRVVFLAFHGARVVPEEEAGTAGHLHDAPRPMAFALVLLAAGSVAAGYLGLPHALGGSNRLEGFLAPSLAVDHGAAAGSEGIELALMGLSGLAALSGIGLAFVLVANARGAGGRTDGRFATVRSILVKKYFFDDLYDALIVGPIRLVSERILWRGVDVRAVDGAVNLVGRSTIHLAERLRRMQTGSVRSYAASLLLGVVLVLGYYLWRFPF
jgi:NADH-quinone oxidoreductase subunit L